VLRGEGVVKILVADDDLITRRILEHDLESWGHTVVAASDGASAWEILNTADAPRIAVLDWMMPGCSGPEICRAIRRRVSGAYTYLLLVTSREDKADLLRGLAAGADDYLTKPVDTDEFQARLRVGLRVLDLEDKLLKAQEVLQFAASHDSLTHLNNRAAIDDMLRREMARAQRDHSSLSVLLLDIDHFKSINDSYGHAVGDEVLRELASRFSAAIRAYDSVGRYGGEEFLVILPGCDATGAAEQAERVLEAIRSRSFETSAGALRITASIGAVCNKDVPDSMPLSLLRAADTALYEAKYGGRDRIVILGVNESQRAKLIPSILEPQAQ
jgi:two-component system cell cycle response regulator